MLCGLSCFWARCTGEEHKRNFLICRRDRTSGSHWALLLEAKLGTEREPAAQLCRAQLLNWYLTVEVSKLFLFLFYQLNNNFPWQCLYGAGGTDTRAIGRETAVIWKLSKEMKKSIESIWSSRNWDFLSHILLWAKILSARQGFTRTSQVSRAPCPGGAAVDNRLHAAEPQPQTPHQTTRLSRCPNYGSKTKASRRDGSFCSLLPAAKFSRHTQTLLCLVVVQYKPVTIVQSGVTAQTENLFPPW